MNPFENAKSKYLKSVLSHTTTTIDPRLKMEESTIDGIKEEVKRDIIISDQRLMYSVINSLTSPDVKSVLPDLVLPRMENVFNTNERVEKVNLVVEMIKPDVVERSKKEGMRKRQKQKDEDDEKKRKEKIRLREKIKIKKNRKDGINVKKYRIKKNNINTDDEIVTPEMFEEDNNNMLKRRLVPIFDKYEGNVDFSKNKYSIWMMYDYAPFKTRKNIVTNPNLTFSEFKEKFGNMIEMKPLDLFVGKKGAETREFIYSSGITTLLNYGCGIDNIKLQDIKIINTDIIDRSNFVDNFITIADASKCQFDGQLFSNVLHHIKDWEAEVNLVAENIFVRDFDCQEYFIDGKMDHREFFGANMYDSLWPDTDVSGGMEFVKMFNRDRIVNFMHYHGYELKQEAYARKRASYWFKYMSRDDNGIIDKGEETNCKVESVINSKPNQLDESLFFGEYKFGDMFLGLVKNNSTSLKLKYDEPKNEETDNNQPLGRIKYNFGELFLDLVKNNKISVELKNNELKEIGNNQPLDWAMEVKIDEKVNEDVIGQDLKSLRLEDVDPNIQPKMTSKDQQLLKEKREDEVFRYYEFFSKDREQLPFTAPKMGCNSTFKPEKRFAKTYCLHATGDRRVQTPQFETVRDQLVFEFGKEGLLKGFSKEDYVKSPKQGQIKLGTTFLTFLNKIDIVHSMDLERGKGKKGIVVVYPGSGDCKSYRVIKQIIDKTIRRKENIIFICIDDLIGENVLKVKGRENQLITYREYATPDLIDQISSNYNRDEYTLCYFTDIRRDVDTNSRQSVIKVDNDLEINIFRILVKHKYDFAYYKFNNPYSPKGDSRTNVEFKYIPLKLQFQAFHRGELRGFCYPHNLTEVELRTYNTLEIDSVSWFWYTRVKYYKAKCYDCVAATNLLKYLSN